MADFSDDFTVGADTLLKNHTPTGAGTAYVYVGTNDDAYSCDNISDNLEQGTSGVGTVGVGYDRIDPEPTSADQQAWGEHAASDRNRDGYVLVLRLVDEDNFAVGHQIFGTGSAGRRFTKCVSGTPTDLSTSQPVNGEWIRTKIVGTTASFWRADAGAEPTDPEEDTNWTQVGMDTTVSDHSSEVSCGFVRRGSDADSVALASFRASSIGAAPGGASLPVFSRQQQNRFIRRKPSFF